MFVTKCEMGRAGHAMVCQAAGGIALSVQYAAKNAAFENFDSFVLRAQSESDTMHLVRAPGTTARPSP